MMMHGDATNRMRLPGQGAMKERNETDARSVTGRKLVVPDRERCRNAKPGVDEPDVGVDGRVTEFHISVQKRRGVNSTDVLVTSKITKYVVRHSAMDARRRTMSLGGKMAKCRGHHMP